MMHATCMENGTTERVACQSLTQGRWLWAGCGEQVSYDAKGHICQQLDRVGYYQPSQLPLQCDHRHKSTLLLLDQAPLAAACLGLLMATAFCAAARNQAPPRKSVTAKCTGC
jgi:hypothetical protein